MEEMSVKWMELGEGNWNQDKKDNGKGIGNWIQKSENYVEERAQVGLWMLISSSNQPQLWYVSLEYEMLSVHFACMKVF